MKIHPWQKDIQESVLRRNKSFLKKQAKRDALWRQKASYIIHDECVYEAKEWKALKEELDGKIYISTTD